MKVQIYINNIEYIKTIFVMSGFLVNSIINIIVLIVLFQDYQ